MPSAAGKRPARWNICFKTPEWICTAVLSRRYWIAGWRFLRTTRLALDANTMTSAGGRSLARSPTPRGTVALYRIPEIVTRGRFPDGGESDSTWRTQEDRHVGSDTIAPGF